MTNARGYVLAEYLTRDTLVVAVALAVITILAWTYLVVANGQMQMPVMARAQTGSVAHISGMSDMDMRDMKSMTGMSDGRAVNGTPSSGQRIAVTSPAILQGTPTYFLFLFTMWAVMMVGMMTPSVSPMVLIYSRLAKASAAQGTPFASSAWFAGGYLVAWTMFALIASLAQYALDRAALLSPMMVLQSRAAGGAVLVAAGIYQWLPVKAACLSNCRAPLAFVQRHGGFSASALGSIRLGVLHGLYCIGCCWALMLVLFVAGVMNLFWIAAMMLVVLAEKLLPAATYLSRALGVAAIAWGAWLLVT